MIKQLFLTVALFLSLYSYSQNVGINATGAAPNAKAMLDIADSAKGLLIPRVALLAINSTVPIGAGLPTSMMVYNTQIAGTSPNQVVPGYYYWNGTKWVAFSGQGSLNWSLLGNAGTADGTHFIGTTDNIPLSFRVNNQKAGRIDHLNGNHFFGYQSGFSNSSGLGNTGFGHQVLYSNQGGYYNTATGYQAMYSNTTGCENTAHGYQALYSHKRPDYGILEENTAVGFWALRSDTIGFWNTAVGGHALSDNTGGYQNTAVGVQALGYNKNGVRNVAVGIQALGGNISGSGNIGIGYGCLSLNQTGGSNIAIGEDAIRNNTSSSRNIGIGNGAVYSFTTGIYNTAVGENALYSLTTGNNNVAIGYNAGNHGAYKIGNQNTLVGAGSNCSVNNLTNATALGSYALVTASNTMILGNNAVVGWGFGVQPTAGTDAIRVGTGTTNGNGARLTLGGVWTNASDSTKKYNIKKCSYGLKEVLKLRPVSYNMKGTNYKDIGFIAQEVKQVLPELVYGDEGDMTMSYGQITAVLTNALQEQQKIIEAQQKQINELKQLVEKLHK